MAQKTIIKGSLSFSSLKVPTEGKFGKEYKIDLVDFKVLDADKLDEKQAELLKKSIWESQDGVKHITVKAGNELTQYNVAGKTRRYNDLANFDIQDAPVTIAVTFGHSDKYNSDFMRFAGIKFESEPKFWSSDPFAEGVQDDLTSEAISDNDLPF